MWELKKNYQKRHEIITQTTESDMKYPICNGKKDTIQHVLECQTAETGVQFYYKNNFIRTKALILAKNLTN